MRLRTSSLALATLAVLGAAPARAQRTISVPPVRCPAPVPSFARTASTPDVSVRLMAEGEFPDADAAAARALVMLMRDALREHAPASTLGRIDVQGRIAASVQAASDLSTIAAGKSLVTVVVQRAGDSAVVSWNVRTAGAALRGTAPGNRRLAARVDEIGRLAHALADAAVSAASIRRHSLNEPPARLATLEAAEAYVLGLAEALSSTPDALTRARTALVRATSMSPATPEPWRWRASVEQQLAEWYRAGEGQPRDVLRRSALEVATRASLLAPRSVGARLALADAYMASGARGRAESMARSVATGAAAGSPGVEQRLAHLSRARGDDARALAQLRTAAERSPWDASILLDLAMLARTRGDRALACHALNGAIANNNELAPAYVLRGLLRGDLGERREAWADTEVATRLGHPEWGERGSAILDVRYGQAAQSLVRLGPLGGIAAQPVNALEAYLLAQAIALSAPPRERGARLAALKCGGAQADILARDLSTALPGLRVTCVRD